MNPLPETVVRCQWARAESMHAYHDLEWGVPVHDDRVLFEFLLLEGAQAGLSWETILKKRENYRKAFDGFNYTKIARYDAAKVQSLLADAGIVRNRLKVNGAIKSAQEFLRMREEFGSFDAWLWNFVEGKPIRNRWKSMKDVPAKTPLSDQISKALLKRGFKFVGSTIIYAFLQAVGVVNDHLVSCPKHAASARL